MFSCALQCANLSLYRYSLRNAFRPLVSVSSAEVIQDETKFIHSLNTLPDVGPFGPLSSGRCVSAPFWGRCAGSEVHAWVKEKKTTASLIILA